ncbi:MAG: hypothetical protein KKF50_03180 [Nanoarchaeota archaeon]|nr:hypothetical protein [Nanoarchaeota archaeon]
MKKIPQDIIGNIALLKFPRRTLWLTKKLKARKFLKQHKGVETVLEKTEGFSGELRTMKTKHLAGIKTKEATYKENECTFKFNVDESYFSPRLSNERKVIADEINKLVKINEPAPTNNKNKSVKVSKILVMFAGISPYPIVIARRLKLAKKKAKIISNELNEQANKESERNIKLNRFQDYITLVNGDAKKLPTKIKEKQDIILMPRPNLKETFLKTALKLSKKGTTIFYHGFGTKEEVIKEIKRDTIGKIGKISIRKAGDIGPYAYRWQASFKVLIN